MTTPFVRKLSKSRNWKDMKSMKDMKGSEGIDGSPRRIRKAGD
jgi:hypothetical protein